MSKQASPTRRERRLCKRAHVPKTNGQGEWVCARCGIHLDPLPTEGNDDA